MATSFLKDIKPYFSACYRQHMLFMLDLWLASDVQGNWQGIYDSVETKQMPRAGCPEGVWDDVTRQRFLTEFSAWKSDGYLP